MSLAKEIYANTVLLSGLKQLMWSAGDCIMEIYQSDEFGTELKGDDSPVTKADLAAHKTLVNGLAELTPDIPIVSEEDCSSLGIPKNHDTYWLIDPLDGTKEFLKRNDEFTCNLALIENNRPSLGLVGIPAQDELFVGGPGLGAIRERRSESPITLKRTPQNASVIRVVASKSHLNDETKHFIDALDGEVELVQAGSSLKFLKIATNEADLYPRLAPTCEWDTAAAQAVLEGSGGVVVQADGSEMVYGKENILNPHFIARAV